MNVPELNPPERLLMGPGPSNVDPQIMRAMSAPVVGHLDPTFVAVMTDTMSLLRGLFETQNPCTVPISGTGSSALEAIMDNLLEPGDDVIVGVIGYFGQRLADMAGRTGANVRVIEAPWGEVIDPEQLQSELKRKPAKLVAFVHAETSTGAHQRVEALAPIAHRYGALIAIDSVTSLGGMPVSVDTWGVDAAGSCSQKCIGSPPGMGPVTFGPRAIAAMKNRQHPVHSWYLDMGLLLQYWGEGTVDRVFHHTAPISSIYAFREGLRMIAAEGLRERFRRHLVAHQGLVAGLEAMGLSLFTPPRCQLPMLNVINIPEGIADAAVRRRLLELNIEIGGGFGPLKGKTWRVGLMGANARPDRVLRLLAALEQVLAEAGWKAPRGEAVDAAAAAMAVVD